MKAPLSVHSREDCLKEDSVLADPTWPVKQAVVTPLKKRRQGNRAGTIQEAHVEAKRSPTRPDSGLDQKPSVESAAVDSRPSQQAVVTPTRKRYALYSTTVRQNSNGLRSASEAIGILHRKHAKFVPALDFDAKSLTNEHGLYTLVLHDTTALSLQGYCRGGGHCAQSW